MDLTARIINAAIDHWPLVAGIAAASWWLFPRAVRDSLNNGGGDVIRRIVSEENARQTAFHTRDLDERLRRHEEQEERRFSRVEDEVFRRRRR